MNASEVGRPAPPVRACSIRPGRGMSPASTAVRSRPLALVLQGPVGPFFRQLHRSLLKKGYDVCKVNFSAGDWLYSLKTESINFRGSPQDWVDWLETMADRNAPAFIVLFGDSRPYHKETLEMARRRNIPVWCPRGGIYPARFHHLRARRQQRALTAAALARNLRSASPSL